MKNDANVEWNPAIKKYVNAIERKLNLPMDVKSRVMSDVSTTIRARYEAGESYEDIMADMGTPKQVAAELNEQMKEIAYQKSPWRFAFLAIAILAAIWLIVVILVPKLFAYRYSVGIIGGADGPTAIYVTTESPPLWLYIICAVALVVIGIVGYIRMGHRKNKTDE